MSTLSLFRKAVLSVEPLERRELPALVAALPLSSSIIVPRALSPPAYITPIPLPSLDGAAKPSASLSLKLSPETALLPRATLVAAAEIQDKPKVDLKLAIDGMNYFDVQQGESCTCWLMAALSAVADARPGYLESLISDKGKGVYEVKLYDINTKQWVTETVTFNGTTTLADPTPKTPAYAPNGPAEFWPVIFQRAYLQHHGLPEKCGGEPFDKLPQTRKQAGALATLTGQPAQTFATADDKSRGKADSLKRIQDALKENRPVLASTNNCGFDCRCPDSDHVSNLRLVKNHCYTVLYMYQHDSGAWQVLLYNPHGNDGGDVPSGVDDGFIVIPWEDFAKSMSDYTIGAKQ